MTRLIDSSIHPHYNTGMDRLDQLSEIAHQAFEARSKARDQALGQARRLVRHAANAIRAIHRAEYETVDENLAQAQSLAEGLKTDLLPYPELYFAGYTQDAIKEYAEASITRALVQGLPLPLPHELGVEIPAYLCGLAEVTGELRRRILDLLRQGYSPEAERLLACMDDIYSLLMTIDYPDAITNGLRRQSDLVRGLLERTRGDLTISLRESKLQDALERAIETRNGK